MLVDADGTTVAEASADDAGSAIFYDVAPGDDYTVREETTDAVLGSEPFPILEPGGTPDCHALRPDARARPQLRQDARRCRARDDIAAADGPDDGRRPFATVIEYSGYQVAAPHDLLNDVAAVSATPIFQRSARAGDVDRGRFDHRARDRVRDGERADARHRLLGWRVDLFDYPTVFDGYDAVETVAAQDWVKGGKVGMVGISFSGMTQLFTGGTKPPHLAAVAPLSVTDDLYRTVGSPGGIFNRGFAQSWSRSALKTPSPRPRAVNRGRRTRRPRRRALHREPEAALAGSRVFAILSENPDRVPELYDHRAPASGARTSTFRSSWPACSKTSRSSASVRALSKVSRTTPTCTSR